MNKTLLITLSFLPGAVCLACGAVFASFTEQWYFTAADSSLMDKRAGMEAVARYACFTFGVLTVVAWLAGACLLIALPVAAKMRE